MTAIPQISSAPAHSPATKPLSRRLLHPLQIISARARLLAFLLNLFQLLTLAAASWLVIILLLGSFHDIPPLVIVLFALAAWLIVIAALVRFIVRHRRLKGGGHLASAALLIDAALPATHERISSALELSQETDPRFKGSPELVACLIRQAEKDADKLDPHAVVSGKSVLKWFLVLIPILLLWLALLAVKTPTILLGFQRTLEPWSAAPPPPQATLQLDPGNITKAQGDDLTINLTVTPPPGSPTDPSDLLRASLTRHFPSDAARSGEAGGAALTSEMERTGPRTFHLVIPSLEQSFTYEASSLGARSQTYSVIVQSRPSLAVIEIAYTFPTYTGLHPRTDISRDTQSPASGAIDALVGTAVKITIDSDQLLTSANLDIADNAPNNGKIDLLPTTPGTSPQTRFAADFIIAKSTTYSIHLVNQQNLANKDTQPHPITARIDNPPQITITSPTQSGGSEGGLAVRPDDLVPIHYSASDDFGLTRIDALVQVDDLPVTLFPVALPQPKEDGPQKDIADIWNLALPSVLAAFPTATAPQRVFYQLRATDNRDPIPQTALSARQILELDRAAIPLAQRQDNDAAQTLADSVKKVAADLDQAQQKLSPIQDSGASGAKAPDAAAAARQLDAARKDLTSAAAAAEKSTDSHLAGIAKEARDIADNPLKRAQEKAADSQLASDQPQAAARDAAQASQNITEAREKLNDLSRRLAQTTRDQSFAQQERQINEQQQKLSDALVKNSNDPRLLAQQRELQKKTEQLIKENPALQQPAAQSHQAQSDQLAINIDALQQSQKSLAESMKNQPASAKEDPAATAAGIQERVSQNAQHIEDAKKNLDPPTRPSDPAKQEAAKLADDIKKEAQKISSSPSSTPQQKQAAKDAAASADNAKRGAEKLGDAQSDNQQLKQAADQFAQAAKPPNSPDAKNEGPSPQARENAASQRKLADQIDQAAKDAQSLQQQTKNTAPEMSERAAKAAAQLQQAAKSQRAAASASEQNNPSAGASAEKQSTEQLATAMKSLQSGSAAPGGSDPSAQQNPVPSSPGNSPRQSLAQSIQAAREAQSQAARGGNPAAARRAADELQHATDQLAAGNAGSPGSPSPTAQKSGESPGTNGNSGSNARNSELRTQNSRGSGIGVTSNTTPAPSADLPKSVQEIGLSPSDWARLPPNMQEQLLHSADQPGPPAYHEMIKNYYSRIARLQQDSGAPQ